jgi:sugar phosphate permease
MARWTRTVLLERSGSKTRSRHAAARAGSRCASATSHGVADDDQGLVGGVINTSRQIGAAIGAALLPAVAGAVDHGTHASAASGDRVAMLAAAVAAALALIVALRSVRRTAPRARHG